LIRRGAGATSNFIKHGPLTYDQSGRVATLEGKMVELSARELGLLEVLLQRAGRLVSKDQLVERLCEWGDEVSNNAIEVYIHRLRKKIEKGPVRIATVRGLAVWRNPGLDAHAAAAPVAGESGADLDRRARHCGQAV
jgi:two-component system, OmpR family, response regulator